MTGHKNVHIEFAARNPTSSARFYKGVFGCEIQDVREMNYIMVDPGDGLGVGFPEIDGEELREGDISVSISTVDIPSTLKKIEMPESEILTMGWSASFQDRSGNCIAAYKSMPGTFQL